MDLKPKKEKKPKQPRITRRQRKVDEMYRNNPQWAEEDDYKFLTNNNNSKMKKRKMTTGGMTNPNAKVSAAKKASTNGVRTRVNNSSIPKAQKGGTKSSKPWYRKADLGLGELVQPYLKKANEEIDKVRKPINAKTKTTNAKIDKILKPINAKTTAANKKVMAVLTPKKKSTIKKAKMGGAMRRKM